MNTALEKSEIIDALHEMNYEQLTETIIECEGEKAELQETIRKHPNLKKHPNTQIALERIAIVEIIGRELMLSAYLPYNEQQERMSYTCAMLGIETEIEEERIYTNSDYAHAMMSPNLG